MNLVDNTLFRVIVVVALLCALAWGVMGASLRMSTRASVLFCIGNLLLATGLTLTTLRTSTPSYLYYHLADWTILAGMAVFHLAILRLVHVQPPSRWEAAVPVLLAMAVTAPFAPAPTSVTVMTLAFAGTVTWFSFTAYMDCYRGLDPKVFSKLARSAVGGPLFLMGLMMAVLSVQVVAVAAVGGQVQPAAEGKTPFLWSAFVFLFLVNIAMAGLTAGRLIMRVRALAEQDHLTGCMNRRSLEGRLRIEMARTQRMGGDLACVFFDLDHFKRINDTLGHKAGDAALIHTVRLVGALLRDVDVLGRFGGEEFTVVMPGTTLHGAQEAANRMRRALERHPLMHEGHAVPLTASFGVAALMPHETQDGLLGRADAAMYEAKRLGRNRVEADASLGAGSYVPPHAMPAV